MTTEQKIIEEYKLRFNEVLNRMYNLEIVPEIQSMINERIPDGGFRLFKNDELEQFLLKALATQREAVIEECMKELTVVRKEVPWKEDINRYNQYLRRCFNRLKSDSKDEGNK